MRRGTQNGRPFRVHDNIVKNKLGAELCQAQEKLGLAMPALPSKKLGSSSI